MNGRDRPADDLDTLDAGWIECREIERAAAVVQRVIHPHPIDQYEGVIRVQTSRVDRGAAATRARLIQVDPRNVTQDLRDAGVAGEFDFLPRDQGDGAGCTFRR